MKELINDIYENNLYALEDKLAYTDINVLDEKNNSLLHYAIYYKRVEICYFLINKHIFLNQQNNHKLTPLYLACHYNLVGVVASLLKNNANINILDSKGDSPFYHACSLGRDEIIEVFLEYDNTLFSKCNRLNNNGYFALIYSNNFSLFKKYFDKNFLYHKNNNNDTMLHIATKKNNYQIVDFLVNERLYLNIFNKDKITPLYYAVDNNNYNMTKLLLKNGAFTFFDDKLIDKIKRLNENLLIYDKTREYYVKYKLHYSIIKNDEVSFNNYLNNYQLLIKDFYNYSAIDLAKIVNKNLYKKLIDLKRLKYID